MQQSFSNTVDATKQRILQAIIRQQNLPSEAELQIQIQCHWTCSQKAKNQKAKQTIMHCTTKQYNTRQEMKCNAVANTGQHKHCTYGFSVSFHCRLDGSNKSNPNKCEITF